MVNKVILVGNVGKDPETKHLEGDSQVTNFSLATTKRWKNKKGEKQEETQWHNIVLWRGLSKIAEQYVKKGDKLYVEGEIVNRSYDDKDGNKRYITEIVGSNMTMLGRKSSGAAPSTPTQESDGTPAEDDDLPF